MNKILPIILVVVLSGCASSPTKIISSSEQRITIEYNPAKVSAGDLITMGHEHCSKVNMNVSNFVIENHDCSHIEANHLIHCAVSFMCSNKYIFTGTDYRILQNRINIDRERMSENPKPDDVDWNRVLKKSLEGLDRANKDFGETIERNERTRKDMETDTRIRRIEDKLR